MHKIVDWSKRVSMCKIMDVGVGVYVSECAGVGVQMYHD
jgi:hypothetical protein